MTRGRVAVIGGGIAGLATTIALRRAGWEVTTYERADALGTAGGALGLHPNAMLALQALGAADPVLAAGAEVRRWQLQSWTGRRLASWSQLAVSQAVGAPSVTVPRVALQRALIDAVGPGALHLSRPLVRATQAGSQVELEFATGHTDRVGLLVGADGLHSVTRALVDDASTGPRYAGFIAWRAVTDQVVQWPTGLAQQTLGRGATFGCWPLADGRLYWVATLAQPDTTAADPVREHHRLGQAFARAHAPIPELIRSASPEAILRTPIYDRPIPADWHRGRVVLVGDAVHPMLPNTGQGAGQALLDTLALADALSAVTDLADGSALRGALGAYQDTRRASVAAVAGEARWLGKMHHLRNPIARFMRDRALRRTPEEEWIRRMNHRSRLPMEVGGPQ